MKRIAHERLLEVLSYSLITGKFIWTKTRNSRTVAGTSAGYENPASSGGRSMGIYVDGQAYRASHLAWFYLTKEWPKGIVDHRDGNHMNQAWLNLRDTDHQINAQNRRKAHITNKSSGLLGVHACPATGKWRARIWINGKNQSLGSFVEKDDAHQAYLTAKRQMHAGCTI